MTLFSSLLTTDMEEHLTFWQIITGHRAIFVYTAVLLCAIVALMLLFIIRSVRDVQAREKERRLKKERRRFSRLSELDAAAKDEKEIKFDDNITLPQLCEKFCNFASSQMGLYYEPETVRAFIASLAVSRLVIMQGISGTGKTSLAYAFGKFIRHDASIVPVQPSWKDRTDMLGYYNEFTGKFTETDLLYDLYSANTDGRIYLTVLDEMNISRVEYYFAEFLSVLELPELASRKIEVISDVQDNDPKLLVGGKLTVPDNIWFIGTANNDDSTLSISDKVYDRAMVIELKSRAKMFSAPFTEPVSISAAYLQKLYAQALTDYEIDESIRTKLEQIDAYMSDHLQITFGNRIMRQTEKFLPVYRACGGTEYQALDLILSKKVLRKLEIQNPVFVSAEADGLISAIERIFGEGRMPLCVSYLKKFIRI